MALLEGGGLGVGEDEAVGGAVGEMSRVRIHDRIEQAAGRTHDWNGAVREAVKLIQSARFKQAGHEEKIGTGLDLMGKVIGKAEVRPALAGKLAGQLFEEGVVFWVADTEHDELDVALKEAISDGSEQIPAFLGVEPADLGEQWHVRPLGEARPPLEPGFAGSLTGHDGRCIVLAGDHRLAGGAPDLGVDSVDDTAQVGRSIAEQAVQTRAVAGRLDLSWRSWG